jgi:hypothetical protein
VNRALVTLVRLGVALAAVALGIVSSLPAGLLVWILIGATGWPQRIPGSRRNARGRHVGGHPRVAPSCRRMASFTRPHSGLGLGSSLGNSLGVASRHDPSHGGVWEWAGVWLSVQRVCISVSGHFCRCTRGHIFGGLDQGVTARTGWTILDMNQGPHNNEMQRTKRGSVGASPLISVFAWLQRLEPR